MVGGRGGGHCCKLGKNILDAGGGTPEMDFPKKGAAAELAWRPVAIQRHGFDGSTHPTPRRLFRRVLLLMAVFKGFIVGKTAHLHTFFKIRAGRTTHLFDPNRERKSFTDIYLQASLNVYGYL